MLMLFMVLLQLFMALMLLRCARVGPCARPLRKRPAPAVARAEQPRSDYRSALRKLADCDLELLGQGDADPSVNLVASFDAEFYASLASPSLGPHCVLSYPRTADRKAVVVEDEKRTVPFLFEEVKLDTAFVDEVNKDAGRDTGARDRTPDRQVKEARAYAAALELTEQGEQLMLFLCMRLPQMIDPSMPEPEQSYEDQFALLKEANDDEGVPDGQRRRMKRRKHSKVGLRKVTVLMAEINRRLLE
eukprot:gene41120-6702_t